MTNTPDINRTVYYVRKSEVESARYIDFLEETNQEDQTKCYDSEEGLAKALWKNGRQAILEDDRVVTLSDIYKDISC